MSNAIHVLAAGHVALQRDDGDRANDPRHRVQPTNTPDFGGSASVEQPRAAKRKRRATLAALLALRGFSLQVLPVDAYLASRWNLSCELADLDAVGAFADRVAATA